jgi:hypothetical protein
VIVHILGTCAVILGWCFAAAGYRRWKCWPTGSGPTHYGSIRPR